MGLNNFKIQILEEIRITNQVAIQVRKKLQNINV